MSDPQGRNAVGRETPGPDVQAAETPGPSAAAPTAPRYAARSYRSKGGVAAGVMLLLLVLWLSVDALLHDGGRAQLIAVAVLVLTVPLVVAFTLWPVVQADDDRLTVRNPFRTITAPWGEVESIRSALSVELFAGGTKYQIWAIPVSLRERKRAGRRAMIAKGDAAAITSRRRIGLPPEDSRFPAGGPGLRSRAGGGGAAAAGYAEPESTSAWADRTVEELRRLGQLAAERGDATSTGTVSVSWTWWIIAPAVLGAVALAVLLATG
jgi:hypothetical protein